MALIKNPLSGGGNGGGGSDIVNGIIESYKSSSEYIAPNTFVEFVNAGMLDTVDGPDELTTALQFGALSNQAIPIGDNKVLLIYGSDSGTNKDKIYGNIITISAQTISAGGEQELISGTSYGFHACKISDTSIFIAYGSGSNYELASSILTISGSTITAGTQQVWSVGTYTGGNRTTVYLGNNKVFVAHKGASGNRYLYGFTVSISGTTMTLDRQDTLIASGNSGDDIGLISNGSATLLDDGDVFIARPGPNSSPYSAYGQVITISSWTVGTAVALTSVVTNDMQHSFLLSSGAVFIECSGYYTNDYATKYAYGVVATVSSRVINAGAATFIQNANAYGSVLEFKPNRLVGMYGSLSSNNFVSIGMNILGTSIEIGTPNVIAPAVGVTPAISSARVSMPTMAGSNILYEYRTEEYGSEKWYCVLSDTSGLLKVKTSEMYIDGLTKSACAVSSPGDVWVLNTSESE